MIYHLAIYDDGTPIGDACLTKDPDHSESLGARVLSLKDVSTQKDRAAKHLEAAWVRFETARYNREIGSQALAEIAKAYTEANSEAEEWSVRLDAMLLENGYTLKEA